MQTQTPIDLPIPCACGGVLRMLPLALVCSTLPVFAQNGSGGSMPEQTLNLDLKRIASVLSGMVGDGRAAGVSLLIWKDGHEAYFGSAGLADREAGRRMTRDAIVQI